MRFIHIADIHLGVEPDAGKNLGRRRPNEIWESLERIIDQCNRQKIELLLIAGDLFHRQPLLRELKEVNTLFMRLNRTQVVFSAGNHDYLKKDSFYRTFSWPEHVHMLRGRKLESIVIPELDTCVHGFSYDSKEILQTPPYEEWKLSRNHRCEILMLHGGDDRHLPLRKEMLNTLGYDYIALGHIHKPQILIPGMAAWPGALEPTDKNDTGKHGYIVGEIRDGSCEIEFVPFATREYINLEIQTTAEMSGYEVKQKVEEAITSGGIQNIYKIILKGFRGAGTIYDLEGFDVYGNITEIVDETKPAYRYDKLWEENRDNILGQLIDTFRDYNKDSVEYSAMCEGVRALMETRRE